MQLDTQDYQVFKANCYQYISTDHSFPQSNKTLTNKFLCIEEINSDSKSFLFVVELTSFELTNCLGVENWLGNQEKQYSMYDFLKIIHPSYVHQHMQMAITSIEVSSQNIGFYKFPEQKLTSYLPIKDTHNKYWWVKQESTPFRFDSKNRIVSYACRITVQREYDDRLPESLLGGHEINDETEIHQLFLTRYRERIWKYLPFSKRQIEILTLYADGSNRTHQWMEEMLQVSARTIERQRKIILFNARNRFQKNFNSIHEVVRFLKNQKII